MDTRIDIIPSSPLSHTRPESPDGEFNSALESILAVRSKSGDGPSRGHPATEDLDETPRVDASGDADAQNNVEGLVVKYHPIFSTAWTADDETATTIFKAWDELPRSVSVPWTPEEELRVANRVEYLIPSFDAMVRHSNEGFRAWIARHQRAMQNGWTEFLDRYATQTLAMMEKDDELFASPPTLETAPAPATTNVAWRTEAWISRYANIAHVREQIINHRLRENLGIGERGQALFWGISLSELHPRAKWREMGVKRPQGRWFWPLHLLLRAMAESRGWDIRETWIKYWQTLPAGSTCTPSAKRKKSC